MNKKAQEEGLWFLFLEIPLTIILVFALVMMPKALVEKNFQPVQLDEAIEAQQLKAQMWKSSLITASTSPFEYNPDLSAMGKTVTKKKMAYKITIGGKEAIYDKKVLEDAEPIAPFIYAKHEEKQKVNVDGKTEELTIAIYAPYKYEIKI